MDTTLKELAYPNNWVGSSCIVYALFPDRRCVFSGITADGTSTVNAAENIIRCLAEQEELNPFQYRFFDLQTHLQYGQHGNLYCPHPGEFLFKELTIRLQQREADPDAASVVLDSGAPFVVSHWQSVSCPPEVVQLFAVQIGDRSRPAYQCATHVDHDPHRLHPGNPHDQARMVHPDILPVFDEIKRLSRELQDRPDRRDDELEKQIDQAWVRLRELLASGRFVHPQTIVSLELPLFAQNRLDAVEFLHRRLLRMMPESTEALCMLAATVAELGRLREAEEMYEVAIETSARILARARITLSALTTGTIKNAKVIAHRHTHLLFDVGSAYAKLAKVQLQQRKLTAARASAKCAIRLEALGADQSAGPYRLLAETYIRLGKIRAAHAALKKCLAIFEENEGHDYLDTERVQAVLEALSEGRPDLVQLLDDLDKQTKED